MRAPACASQLLEVQDTRGNHASLAQERMATGASEASGCQTGAKLASTPPSASRQFLVVCAARERCGACLGVPAARRGSFGVGAASDGAGRRAARLQRAVGVCVHWVSAT